jgi:hypothetical protein
MAADLNGDVAPLRIEDVERIVVDVGHRPFWFNVMGGVDIPHRRLGSTHQNQKQAQPWVMWVFARYSSANSCLRSPALTMHKRNALGFRMAVKPTAKLKRPAMRMRCVLSGVSSDPARARHHTRKPPAVCPMRNTHSIQSGLRNHSCRSTALRTGCSMTQAWLRAKHIFLREDKSLPISLMSEALLLRKESLFHGGAR